VQLNTKDMSKKELLALAAIVVSASGVSNKDAIKSVYESHNVAFADMKDECFIK
jgi:hypothetical protein